MRRLIQAFVLCSTIFLFAVPLVAQNTEDAKKEIEIELPDDASTVVLTMDMSGGYRMKDPVGFEPSPLLQIFADGRVKTGVKLNTVKEVESQIDLVELKPLLVFIVDECHFFEISSESVTEELEKLRVGRTMDAGTTKVEINLKGNSNSVEVYTMPMVAGKYSDVASIASMIAITSRCRQLISKVRLGTDDEAKAVIKLINSALAEKSKDAPKFSMANLQNAEQFVDNRRAATFVQNYKQGEKQMMAYASYQLDTKGNPSVIVEIDELKVKSDIR